MKNLRQHMRDDMKIRNLPTNTQKRYFDRVVAFANHFRKSSKWLGPEDIRNFRLYLEDTGKYKVMVETKGKQAFAAAKKFKPDLIFSDIIMPDRAGEEVAVQIKSDYSLKDIPQVFLTAIVNK